MSYLLVMNMKMMLVYYHRHYNSITGDSGITKLDKQYVRKLRLFEIDFEKNRILSWKRKEIDNQPFDYQLIYEKPQKKEKEKEK